METAAGKIIQLHAADNVVVCIRSLQAGETVLIAGETITVRHTLGIGHKLANKNILCGETIVKYGVPIGSATENIRTGEHVHTHNMKSNYIETYLPEE